MNGQTLDGAQRGRSQASFFSSAASFSLPAGTQLGTDAPRGYYVDMRAKATRPEWPPAGTPPPEQWLQVGVIQWALGSFERYLAGEGEQWLDATLRAAGWLMDSQQQSGRQTGAWLHQRPLPHTFELRPPWLSGMAQGEGASLLVRLFVETGEERYAQAARRALLPLALDSADGGARAWLNGAAFPEEYPTSPPSFVLNGGIFAIWGLHDVGVGLNDAQAGEDFEQAVDTLAVNLHRWDVGYWSRYDLFPHAVKNVASSFYHALHVTQLRMTDRLSPRPVLAETAARWEHYAGSRADRARAFASKALFRVLVPRNQLLARGVPWSAFKRHRPA